MQHSRRAHVVYERLLAQRLLEAADARGGASDSVGVARGSVRVALFPPERGIARQAELFSEKRVAPGFLPRQRPAILHRLTGGLNRVDDPSVPGAAADVAVERLRDRVAVVGLPLLDQVRCADDDAWDAEAALNAAL